MKAMTYNRPLPPIEWVGRDGDDIRKTVQPSKGMHIVHRESKALWVLVDMKRNRHGHFFVIAQLLDVGGEKPALGRKKTITKEALAADWRPTLLGATSFKLSNEEMENLKKAGPGARIVVEDGKGRVVEKGEK